MDDTDRELLRELLDGRLPPERAEQARRLLERDAEARRFVDEHRALWDALAEAFTEPVPVADEAFRRAILESARDERPRRVIPWRPTLAAAALLLAALSLHLARDDGGAPSPDEQQMVRYLHVLRSLPSLERGAGALDLRYDLEVLRAFEGELEGGG